MDNEIGAQDGGEKNQGQSRSKSHDQSQSHQWDEKYREVEAAMDATRGEAPQDILDEMSLEQVQPGPGAAWMGTEQLGPPPGMHGRARACMAERGQWCW